MTPAVKRGLGFFVVAVAALAPAPSAWPADATPPSTSKVKTNRRR